APTTRWSTCRPTRGSTSRSRPTTRCGRRSCWRSGRSEAARRRASCPHERVVAALHLPGRDLLDRVPDVPAVPEGIAHHAGTLAVEVVLRGHLQRCSRRDG